jgi:hypothetical protein
MTHAADGGSADKAIAPEILSLAAIHEGAILKSNFNNLAPDSCRVPAIDGTGQGLFGSILLGSGRVRAELRD